MTLFFENFLELSAEAAPWLILGLVIAGLMKSWLPSKILSSHLGQGKKAIIKAALIGAPLPLCSCGVIPVATELKRSGASDSATAAFLVATPETGIDSMSVSYSLLGPFFAIYRPICAIISAIVTGFLVLTAGASSKPQLKAENTSGASCCSKAAPIKATTSCCSTSPVKESSGCGGTTTMSAAPNWWEKTRTGLHYAATQLLDDLIVWLVVGLLFATVVRTYLPSTFLVAYGSGLTAMLMMVLISIPMYICATASTPVAAGFISAGISPGTALVFMLAGPATNISTLGLIKKELGQAVLIRYLLGIVISAITSGLLLDWLLIGFAIDITQQMAHSHSILPQWFNLSCVAVIAFLSCRPNFSRLLVRLKAIKIG